MSTPLEVSPALADELRRLRERVDELERERNELTSGTPRPTPFSSDYYRLLYEDTPSMSFALCPDGTILSVNRFGADHLGYSAEHLVGQSVLSVFDPIDHQTVREQLAACTEHPYKIHQWEIQKVRRDGARIWVKETARAVRSENGTLIVLVICEDITVQKAAEEQSRGTLQALHALVQMSPLAVMALDTTGETVTLWSKAAEAMFGWHAEEILGHPAPFLTSDKEEESDRLWATLLQKGSLSGVEFRRTRRDGSPIDLALWATMLRDPEGSVTGTLGFLADVTERKRAVEALRASEQRFRALYEQAPLGIAILDSVSGQFQQVNSKYCEITGYSKEDMLALTFQTITYPDDLEVDVSNMARLLSGQIATFRMEKRYIRKDGSTVWVNLTCVPLWLDVTDRRLHIAMVENITDRKLAEQTLQESETRFRQIAETIEEVVWSADPAIGRMLYISPAYERVWGRTCASLYEHPKSFIDAIHPDDRVRVLANLTVQQEGLPFAHEYRIVRPDGVIRWVWDRGFPIFDRETEQLTHYVGVALDLTERKLAEDALRISKEELRKAFEERERLSQDLHDNLLQSLYAVGMGLDLTRQQIKRTSPVNANRLEGSVAQLNAVIRDVRSFIPRMYATTDKTMNVTDAIRSLVRSFVATGACNIALTIEPAAAMQVSPEQTPHILAIAKEALSNSLRHTKADNRSVTLALYRGQVRLEVADDGEGFQLRESSKHGMGIRNMRSRAAKLNSRLAIRTSLKKGTRITLDLPQLS